MPSGSTIELPPMGSAGATGTYASPDPGQTITRPVSPLFAEQIRLLLWSRLLILHVAGTIMGVLMGFLVASGATTSPTLGRVPDWLGAGAFFLLMTESVLGSVFLYFRPQTSLRVLRLIELIHFAPIVIGSALDKAIRLAVLPLDTLADPDLALGLVGTTTQLNFITVTVVYGTLIPNTRRRTLIVVGLMVTTAFLATLAGAVANPSLRPHLLTLITMCAVTLLVPTLVAVFVASRSRALQLEAFEARRELQQVGQYTLKRKLGEGGMGEVWLAEHRLLKRPCAVKFVRADLGTNPTTVARFEREVQSVTGLTHFNTVRVYDYGRSDDGSFYYVMEFLDGPTLEALVKRAGPLDPARAVYLLRPLCGALAEAHAAGLVHRDIKPGNVIVAALGGQRDVVKLLDFGLVQNPAAVDNPLTGAGVVLGTPAYMCPEQAGGAGTVDVRGDIYSVGALAFFALTGRPPFEGDTLGQFITAHLTRTPPRADAVRPGVPADLADVIARCLAKDPAERFQSAVELDRALARCGCAADWSAEQAAQWWQRQNDIVGCPDGEPRYGLGLSIATPRTGTDSPDPSERRRSD